ncbi:MAG: DUF2188 domain-containing protein [Streptosporangiales bacterium]|nr:DUF2188 domain-containing protein [Streptosporangiales bacterium]
MAHEEIFMPSDRVVIEVTPRGREWHVEVDGSPHLVLQSKETAVTEARVQVVALSQSSRIVVHNAAGEVEEEVTCPPEVPPDHAGGGPDN